MRVLVDRYVPYLRGVLEPYAEVLYLEPEQFTADAVRDADALIVRTRTRVGAPLLEHSRVRLVCTATIGFDHIDTRWCEAHGVRWTNAPGCNAQAVCDYVDEALAELRVPAGSVVGVVGVGHVGSLVAAMAERRGYRVLTCDPYRADEAGFVHTPLRDIARQADVLTVHTPLTRGGDHPTFHLVDDELLSLCRPDVVVINAARGGVVDESALLRRRCTAVVDTWEGEPSIRTELLARATLASQHIAGYSIQGKINASNACLSAIAREFGLPELTVDMRQVPLPGDSEPGWIARLTEQLRLRPQDFELLRETYPLR